MNCKALLDSCLIRSMEDDMDEMQDLARRLSDGDYPKYHHDVHGQIWRKASKSATWERIKEENG
jgi:hypothetical protein